MGTAIRAANHEITLTISAELHHSIAEKAVILGVSMEQAMIALLRLGLEEQSRREHELDSLTEQVRTACPEDAQRAMDRLGEALFGR